ncbi:unnamed protein product [Rotaria sp. Silwood1]|nr:unnamed protein product [Rotaria sp. Silwood1]
MLIDIIIIVLISNIFCNIQLTNQISIQSINNDQLNISNFSVVTRYRKTSVQTRITDDHISTILNKLDSSGIALTTQSTSLIETSTSTNQTSFIPSFQTKRLPINPDAVAPDGSLVRTLLTTIGGSMAQFELPPRMTSHAVEHRTVYEIWYFLSGQGEFWRKQNEREEIVIVDADICITIPVGTQFQFRTIGQKSLVAVAITMPPWSGDSEVIPREGIWNASSINIENSSTKLRHSIYLFMIVVTFLIVEKKEMATPKLNKELYANITRLKLLNSTNTDPKFLLDQSPFNEDSDEQDTGASANPKEILIIGRIFPDSEIFKEGAFQIEMKLPPDFPFNPPEVRFLTPIYHPNVDTDGKFCHELLIKEAKHSNKVTLIDVVKAVVQYIDHPNLEHPMRANVGCEYAEKRLDFNRNALEYVKKHALPRS